MKGDRILAVEFLVLIGVASWGALRKGYYPWPPTIVKTGLFVALLGIISAASSEFAAVLGAGFIVANLVKMYGSGTTYMGGLPTDNTGAVVGEGGLTPLSFKANTNTAPGNGGPPNPPGTKPVNPVNPGPGLGPTRPIV
jgi:hypothetical protein